MRYIWSDFEKASILEKFGIHTFHTNIRFVFKNFILHSEASWFGTYSFFGAERFSQPLFFCPLISSSLFSASFFPNFLFTPFLENIPFMVLKKRLWDEVHFAPLFHLVFSKPQGTCQLSQQRFRKPAVVSYFQHLEFSIKALALVTQ